MKVIFLQNIKGVARIGDVKNVADGYARNFLLPRRVAKPATDGTLKEAELIKKSHDADDVARRERATQLLEKLAGVALEIKEGANESGHLYGSVNAETITHELHKQKAITIDPEQIDLPEPIKSVGQYQIKIVLHPEVTTEITINVVA